MPTDPPERSYRALAGVPGLPRVLAGMLLSRVAEGMTAIGEVDILCAHIPPAVPELTYDVVARRSERGSVALLETIRRTQPKLVLYCHVHQPLAARTRIGRTGCVNVGHFRSTKVPHVVEW